MQSDNRILREENDYRIELSAFLYDIEDVEYKFRVKDWGDYVDVTAKNLDDFKPDDNIKYVDRYVYLNRTVYQDKIIEKPVEVIKNVTVYVENETRIDESLIKYDELVFQYNKLDSAFKQQQQRYRNHILYSIISSVLLLINISILIYLRVKK